ncbi:MAG TPA: hypothetical protein VGC76_06835 [Pyrinomonadaceae bacterium]|jgi:hypothetical protein
MTESISELFSALVHDAWRDDIGFSTEVEEANQRLFKTDLSDTERARILNEWLKLYQPCLFGRVAARFELITYCLLTEEDLISTDEAIKDKIQHHRLLWRQNGFEGKKSAFVISIISPTITFAVPDDTVKKLAQKICSLYLDEDIEPDKVYTDTLLLEKTFGEQAIWEWKVGVNYFSSQGDKRWWQDHRIPGGMAFSMNSVGHMAKAGQLLSAIKQVDETFELSKADYPSSKITSLDVALSFAMRTIYSASNAISGKATWLLPLPEDKSQLPIQECPAKLPHFLEENNFCEYQGYYHTDISIPSEYFSAAVERPESTKTHNLDFTYLFRKSIENPDFETMGMGRRIRGKAKRKVRVSQKMQNKISRMIGKPVKGKRKEKLLRELKIERLN